MKYVILAQPKSASTSLLKTLGQLIGEDFGQQVRSLGKSSKARTKGKPRRLIAEALNKFVAPFGLRVVQKASEALSNNRLRDDHPATAYPLLSSIHVDICDFQNGKIGFTPQFALQKQHFPPTAGNLLAFRQTPKVILTRDADDTIDAYSRMTSLPGYFRYFLANDKKFRDALKSEIVSWQEGWKEEAEQHGGLILTFEDITMNTHESLAAALREFGIEVDSSVIEKVELAKERYTGVRKKSI